MQRERFSSDHCDGRGIFTLLLCLSLDYTAILHSFTLLNFFISLKADLEAKNNALQGHKQVLQQGHKQVPGQARNQELIGKQETSEMTSTKH